jgi:hypothetical protein
VRVRVQDPGELGPFIERISRKRLRNPKHLAKLVDSFERGQRDLGSIEECHSVSVRFGKTTTVQHAIAWILAKDPTRKILYVSYAFGFARKQTGKAMEIAKRAGVQLGSTRRKDEWTTLAGGLVKACGIGGQLTGEGFTDIIIDDPHKNRAEAESRVIREGVIEAFFNDIATRRDPRGTNIWVIHARWNVNDLIGVLTRAEPRPFAMFNTPALDEQDRSNAPELFTAEQLKHLRDLVGPYTWASLYQGEPRPSGGALFAAITLAKLYQPKKYREAIGIDLARTTAQRADHNAAVMMRKDLDTGLIDILGAVRARGTIMNRVVDREVVDEGFVKQLVPLIHAHPGAELVMYAAESERSLVDLLSRLLSDAVGRTITVNVVPAAGDKWMRAQRYAASWNGSKVRIAGRIAVGDEHEKTTTDDGRNRDGWQHVFVAEHVAFTGIKGAEDDQVDAGAAAHDWLNDDQKRTTLAEAMASVKGLTATMGGEQRMRDDDDERRKQIDDRRRDGRDASNDPIGRLAKRDPRHGRPEGSDDLHDVLGPRDADRHSARVALRLGSIRRPNCRGTSARDVARRMGPRVARRSERRSERARPLSSARGCSRNRRSALDWRNMGARLRRSADMDRSGRRADPGVAAERGRDQIGWLLPQLRSALRSDQQLLHRPEAS